MEVRFNETEMICIKQNRLQTNALPVVIMCQDESSPSPFKVKAATAIR